MPEQPWFKHWAKDALLSLDLQSLTDHEERVWWRLLAVASLQDPRWTFPVDGKSMAFLCLSTPQKVLAAMRRFAALGMVTLGESRGEIANWRQYQEQVNPNTERVRRFRERGKGVTRNVTGNADETVMERQEERGKKQRRETEPPNGGGAPEAEPPPPQGSELLQSLRLQIGEPKWRQDPSIEAQFVAQIAAHGEEAVQRAVTECHRHRENGRTLVPWPGNVARFLEGEEVQRAVSTRATQRHDYGPEGSPAQQEIERQLRAAGKL